MEKNNLGCVEYKNATRDEKSFRDPHITSKQTDILDMIAPPYLLRIKSNLLGMIIGIIIGVVSGSLVVRYDVSLSYRKWIAMPGEMVMHALMCLIMPTMLCNIFICIREFTATDITHYVRKKCATYFLISSVTASSIGTLVGILFYPVFTPELHSAENEKSIAEVAISCYDGSYLASYANGSIQCASASSITSATKFVLKETSYVRRNDPSIFKIPSTQQQFEGTVLKLISNDTMTAFAVNSLSIIPIAAFFALAFYKEYHRTDHVHVIFILVKQACSILMQLLTMATRFMPIAVASMISTAIAEYSSDSYLDLLFSIGALIVAFNFGSAFMAILLWIFFYVKIRRSPYEYLKSLLPAQMFIIDCSSSIATLPILMLCVDESRQVTRQLSRFVLPVGSTCNFNGTAMYMPLACVYIAAMNGHDSFMTLLFYTCLVIGGAIASFGVVPVPHSGVILLLALWRIVTSSPPPYAVSILVGVDLILDRMRSVVNITNNAIITRILAQECPT